MMILTFIFFTLWTYHFAIELTRETWCTTNSSGCVNDVIHGTCNNSFEDYAARNHWIPPLERGFIRRYSMNKKITKTINYLILEQVWYHLCQMLLDSSYETKIRHTKFRNHFRNKINLLTTAIHLSIILKMFIGKNEKINKREKFRLIIGKKYYLFQIARWNQIFIEKCENIIESLSPFVLSFLD